MKRPDRIIIVGGGFAGVTLAQRLERSISKNTEIVIISTENHQVFTPMLPEVAGRTISPFHVVVAGRQSTRRARWLEARISSINHEKREIHYCAKGGAKSSMTYSHLVLACGSAVNLEKVPGLASRGYPLKTVMDAITMGNDLIGNYETAAAISDAAERRRLLTVVVIGGGFSGVEVAGHLADLMQGIHRYYPELKDERRHIVLLQKGTRILPELNHPALSEFALKKLGENEINVRLETTAQKVTASSVFLNSGEDIGAGMVVCTVGTDTVPLIKDLGLPLEHGRLKTDPDMKVTGAEGLWAIGDCAAIPNAYDGHPCPATAQFAIQQAKQLAENLTRLSKGGPTKPFSFRPRGMLASIGHRNAVAEIYGVRLSGFLAWVLWRGVYLAKLPTFSRKFEVAVDWAWSLLFAPNIVQLRMHRSKEPTVQKSAPLGNDPRDSTNS